MSVRLSPVNYEKRKSEIASLHTERHVTLWATGRSLIGQLHFSQHSYNLTFYQNYEEKLLIEQPCLRNKERTQIDLHPVLVRFLYQRHRTRFDNLFNFCRHFILVFSSLLMEATTYYCALWSYGQIMLP